MRNGTASLAASTSTGRASTTRTLAGIRRRQGLAALRVHAALPGRSARQGDGRARGARRPGRAQGAPDRSAGNAAAKLLTRSQTRRRPGICGIELGTGLKGPDSRIARDGGNGEVIEPRPSGSLPDDRQLGCSVGIMAYNEEANIGDAIENILEQRLPSGQITELIVVASGCEDRTAEIVAEHRQPRFPRAPDQPGAARGEGIGHQPLHRRRPARLC